MLPEHVAAFLKDPRKRGELLSSQKKPDILPEVVAAVDAVEPREKAQLVSNLLATISCETDDAEPEVVDKRDAAFEILQLVDFTDYSPQQLLEQYLAAVKTQQTRAIDAYGSVTALFDAGVYLAPHFPPGVLTKDDIGTAWRNVKRTFTGNKDQESAKEISKRIYDIFRNVAEGDDFFTGERSAPAMSIEQQVLHDSYLEYTKGGKTFKTALWEHTPQFREKCQVYGIALADFWNLSDTAVTLRGVKSLAENPAAQAYIDTLLFQRTGKTSSELSDDEAMYLSDQIVDCARKAKESISISDFDTVTNQFRSLLQKGAGMAPKEQRTIGKQVEKFFREYGVFIQGASIEEINGLLSDGGRLAVARKAYEEKIAQKSQAVAFFDREFALRQPQHHLSFRERGDMYSGDMTGDCTAYHLHSGVNAWTVPVWLSNPGFVFYPITAPDGTFVAKAGIFLAVDADKPFAVVDSFEIATNILMTEDTQRVIDSAIGALSAWGRRIGLHGIKVHSKAGGEQVETFFEPRLAQAATEDLRIVGGMEGVRELRKNMTGKTVREKMYVQTEASEFSDVEGDFIAERRAAKTEEFAGIMRKILEKNEATNGQKAKQLATEGDWEGLFSFIMQHEYPAIANLLGDSWDGYRNVMHAIILDDVGYAENASVVIDQVDMILSARQIAKRIPEGGATIDARIKPLPYIEEDDLPYEDYPKLIDPELAAIDEQGGKVEDVLALLKELSYVGITPAEALSRVYGKKAEERQTTIALYNKLKEIPR